MLKHLFLVLALVACNNSNAQNVVVLDNNSKNASIFDESDPTSFISLLKSNSSYLGYFNMEGISDSLFLIFHKLIEDLFREWEDYR